MATAQLDVRLSADPDQFVSAVEPVIDHLGVMSRAIEGGAYSWAAERLADRTPEMHAAWLRRRWEIQRDRWPTMTAVKTSYARRRNRR